MVNQIGLYFGLLVGILVSEVISFKVSKELKEKYEKLKDVIDWAGGVESIC